VRRGLLLEYSTLAWNVVGVCVLAVLAVAASSPALAAFGLDSLIEIGASIVVVWQLRGSHNERERRALRLIGMAFLALAVYLVAQIAVVIVFAVRPSSSPLGIAWTAATVIVMLALALGKLRTGTALENPVLRAEGKVTLVDAYLAAAVLVGLVLNATFGWWWADPVAALVVVGYALREGWAAFSR
jgi:divalent metal cation (Fe/Co/Zn/Cd) transporter